MFWNFNPKKASCVPNTEVATCSSCGESWDPTGHARSFYLPLQERVLSALMLTQTWRRIIGDVSFARVSKKKKSHGSVERWSSRNARVTKKCVSACSFCLEFYVDDEEMYQKEKRRCEPGPCAQNILEFQLKCLENICELAEKSFRKGIFF